MTAQEIIAQHNKTKTQRMRELAELGLSVREVANLMGTNYGFAYNAINGIRSNRSRVTASMPATPFEFSFAYKYGIELEVYNLNKDRFIRVAREKGIIIETGWRSTRANGWKVTNDASIRGTNGAEIVSPPLQGEEGLEQLRKITEALRECQAKVNRSTGIHIHIESPSRELDFFKRLYKNYILSEGEIDKAMPESRRANNNNYCRSMKKRSWERKINETTTVRYLENALTSGSRYHKLNLQSFWRQGTVEYRQHSGSINYGKIKNWILFVMRLTEYSTQQAMNNRQSPWEAFAGEELREYYEGRIEDLEA